MGPLINRRQLVGAVFQSTHPVWDGTSLVVHAWFDLVISIHPSRVGWDFGVRADAAPSDLFQSTHPVWDGTLVAVEKAPNKRDFNPPIPCGMGLNAIWSNLIISRFQSTHPVWDGTAHARTTIVCQKIFQSTHPVWDGTGPYRPPAAPSEISIHPSRVGWDKKLITIHLVIKNFNPPIPCGMGQGTRSL